MNADDYLPNAETVAAIEKDIANYNERRRHAKAEVARRIPVLLGCYALACAAVFYFIASSAASSRQLTNVLLFGGVASVFGAVYVYRFARKVGVETQQEFRNHILPVLFGFVEGLHYSHGYQPGSFDRLPSALTGNYNRTAFGDIVTGRLDGKWFEISEMTLSRKSKHSDTIVFKGLVLCCGIADAFPGILLGVRWPEPGFQRSLDTLMRSIWDLLGDPGLVTISSGSRLDRTYEFRSDRPEDARALLSGRLGEALEWVNEAWREGTPRLTVRRGELFLMLPSEKDFFELPSLEVSVSYRAHLEPMVRDFASLLAIAAEVQREPKPAADADEGADEALVTPAAQPGAASPDETFIPLLDGNEPPRKR